MSKKIWITRSELRDLIKEELPKTASKPKVDLPPFPEDKAALDRLLGRTPKSRQPTEIIRTKSATPKVGRDPEVVQKKQPTVLPGRDVPRSGFVGNKGKPDPTARAPYNKKDLAAGVDISGDEPETGEVFPASNRRPEKKTGPQQLALHKSDRLKRATPIGKPDPTAKQPYSSAELKKGADVDRAPEKQGFLDRLRSMVSGNKSKPAAENGAFEDAPSHWSSSQKQKFHRDRAIGMRDRAKQYSKMFTDANGANDEKKKQYAKKQYQFYAKAWRDHESALKGA